MDMPHDIVYLSATEFALTIDFKKLDYIGDQGGT